MSRHAPLSNTAHRPFAMQNHHQEQSDNYRASHPDTTPKHFHAYRKGRKHLRPLSFQRSLFVAGSPPSTQREKASFHQSWTTQMRPPDRNEMTIHYQRDRHIPIRLQSVTNTSVG